MAGSSTPFPPPFLLGLEGDRRFLFPRISPPPPAPLRSNLRRIRAFLSLSFFLPVCRWQFGVVLPRALLSSPPDVLLKTGAHDGSSFSFLERRRPADRLAGRQRFLVLSPFRYKDESRIPLFFFFLLECKKNGVLSFLPICLFLLSFFPLW